MIKAIETLYNGYRFRSRLEARWAVFFDALGIKYEYEKEGFELENGEWYLPDFWLNNLQCWLEVKGELPTEKELSFCKQLSNGTGFLTFIAFGEIPFYEDDCDCTNNNSSMLGCAPDGGSNKYKFVEYLGGYVESLDGRHCCHVWGNGDVFAVCNACGDTVITNQTYIGMKQENCGNSKGKYRLLHPISAYQTARSARFEYGEKPIVDGRGYNNGLVQTPPALCSS